MSTLRQTGFTLVEMVISIALMGVLALAAVPLLRLPMASWVDASRRAELMQSMDSAHLALADDFSRALPNSVRINQIGPRVLVEMLEVRASGRHRDGNTGAAQVCPVACTTAAASDRLEAACSETCFTSMGAVDGIAPVPGDWVVVNPLGPGVPGGDPYFGGNATVAGGIKSQLVDVQTVTDGQRLRVAAHAFPSLAASRRFYVVSTPVTWDCDPGQQSLTRRWGYPVASTQPVAFGAGVAASPAATGVVACSARYQAAGLSGRAGVLTMTVRLARNAGSAGSEPIELVIALPVGEVP